MNSVATGTKVLLFVLMEFTSMEECNRSRELLMPVVHHDLIYQCEWHNHSSVFYMTHSERHVHFSEIPPSRPDNLYYYKTNAR
jgi:hypothetical protein